MIESVEVVNGAIPLTATKPKQQWVDEWSTQLYVKVRSDGAVGWGEILPAGGSSRDPYASLVKRLSPAVVGRDESAIEELWTTMRRLTFSGGYGITTGAISGIDIALWDIRAKKAHMSLTALLGGEPSKIPRYASLSRYTRTEDAVRIVGQLLETGYDTIKLHQSGRDALESIRLTRKQFGYGFELSVDLNCAFDYSKAFDFMKRVRRFDLKWVEEPVWPPDDFDSLEKLGRLGPVAAGENFFSYFEFKRLIDRKALFLYQPDIAKMGGVTPALELIKLARRRGAMIAFHNRPDNGWVSTIASSHLAAAFDRKYLIESPPNEVPIQYFKFYGSVDKTGILPGGPGLGIEPRATIPQSTQSKMLRFHES